MPNKSTKDLPKNKRAKKAMFDEDVDSLAIDMSGGLPEPTKKLVMQLARMVRPKSEKVAWWILKHLPEVLSRSPSLQKRAKEKLMAKFPETKDVLDQIFRLPSHPKQTTWPDKTVEASTKKTDMTDQEKKMFIAAKKIRKVVAADFMEKTANPAIAAVGRALLPALRQLGPKVLTMLKNIPPDIWAQIIPHLVGTLTQGMGQEGRAASAKPDIRVLERKLHRAKVTHPQELARLLALATVETRNAHQKKANPDVVEAIRLVRRMEAELQTLKDFS